MGMWCTICWHDGDAVVEWTWTRTQTLLNSLRTYRGLSTLATLGGLFLVLIWVFDVYYFERAVTVSDMVGKYRATEYGVNEIEFRADRTFTQTVHSAGNVQTHTGTWKIYGNTIEFSSLLCGDSPVPFIRAYAYSAGTVIDLGGDELMHRVRNTD